MICCAFVHSHLIYGIEIYGNTCTEYLNKLMILNNKIFRILQHAPLDTPVSQLYATFHTLPLPDLHNLQILKFVHNFIHHQEKLPYPTFSLAISPKITGCLQLLEIFV